MLRLDQLDLEQEVLIGMLSDNKYKNKTPIYENLTAVLLEKQEIFKEQLEKLKNDGNSND